MSGDFYNPLAQMCSCFGESLCVHNEKKKTDFVRIKERI